MAGLQFNGIDVTSEQLAAFKAWLSANGGLPSGDLVGSAAAQVGRRVSYSGLVTTGGDSIDDGGYRGLSVTQRAILKSQGRYRITGTYSVGGKTSPQFIAEQLPYMIADAAPTCVVTIGTNDIRSALNGSASAGDLLARDSIRAIKAAFDVAGKQLVLGGIFPTSETWATIGARHELWRLAWCARNRVPMAHYWPLVAKPDGTYITGAGFDTLHPTDVGADLASPALINALDFPSRLNPFGELVDLPSGATVICPNAVSFGGVGSALPSGYSAVGTGVTYAVEAPTDGSFGNWLSINFNSVVSAVGFTATGRLNTSLGWDVGDKIAVGFRIKTLSSGQDKLRPRVTLDGTFDYGSKAAIGGRGIQLFDDWSGAAGEDYWFYAETTLSAASTVNLRVVGTTTVADAQKISIQRPVIYNLTKNAAL